MPRFSARPLRPPPAVPERWEVQVTGVSAPLTFDAARLAAVRRVDVEADFHCVTTWSVAGLRWAGWRLADVWDDVVAPAGVDPASTHLRVRGGDGYWAVLDLRDALSPDVLLADTLDGQPLDPAHGAPLRLVSPAQYGYKSVKHVTAIGVSAGAPRRIGGAIEHLRARVALEERHGRIAGRLLRWPYRALILPVALAAQRSARR